MPCTVRRWAGFGLLRGCVRDITVQSGVLWIYQGYLGPGSSQLPTTFGGTFDEETFRSECCGGFSVGASGTPVRASSAGASAGSSASATMSVMPLIDVKDSLKRCSSPSVTPNVDSRKAINSCLAAILFHAVLRQKFIDRQPYNPRAKIIEFASCLAQEWRSIRQ